MPILPSHLLTDPDKKDVGFSTRKCPSYNSQMQQPISVSIVILDMNLHIEDQYGGKFDVILHKLTEESSASTSLLLPCSTISIPHYPHQLPTKVVTALYLLVLPKVKKPIMKQSKYSDASRSTNLIIPLAVYLTTLTMYKRSFPGVTLPAHYQSV